MRQVIRRAAETDTDRRHAHATRLTTRLDDRERQVAIAIGHGLTNADIGATLHLSAANAKAHVSAILSKLDFNNRVQIVLLVHDAGLLNQESQSRPRERH
jgi:DNA-binding NarL/FixJ family response regulator